MGATRDLKLVLCVLQDATRRKFQTLLQDLMNGGALAAQVPGYRFEIVLCEGQTPATDCLRQHLAGGEGHAAILAFDRPADAVGNPEIDSREAPDWGEVVRGELKASCATIAIMENPRRLPDVDRVVGETADSAQVLDVLKLVTDRLTYTACPPKRTLPATPIEVRLIRKQRELMDYFKLRHRIYRIMGYLEEDIENTPSQMEIDWCDTIALHFGAYAGVRDQDDFLVGTARVVLSSTEANRRQALLNSYRQWVMTLVEQDPVLQQSLKKGVLPLELPIFQSQKLLGILREVFHRKEVCGELSRVIVAEDYRGTGLSTHLVESALSEAAKVGVNRVFLECLVLHEKLYQKLGFQRIPGAPGTVISVNQTMIGMELSRPAGMPRASGARP